MNSKDLVATEYQLKTDYDDTQMLDPVTFCRMNSPFYDGEQWAVRLLGTCLNKQGEWEYEPMPSSRDSAFFLRCRFGSLQRALDMYASVNG